MRTYRMADPDDRFIGLYEQSFSEIEKVPLENLRRVLGKGAVLDIFEDGGFVGFVYSFISGDAMIIIYFATAPELRGKGYGSRILDSIRGMYRDKRIFLITEPIDDTAPDNDLRIRRQDFYRRNGCRDTGIRILSDDAWFDAMLVQGELDKREMEDIVSLYEKIHNGRERSS